MQPPIKSAIPQPPQANAEDESDVRPETYSDLPSEAADRLRRFVQTSDGYWNSTKASVTHTENQTRQGF